MNEAKFQTTREQILTDVAQNKMSLIDVQNQVDQILSGAVIELLQTKRLFGEVLIQIARQYDNRLDGAMGFKWQLTKLNLVINPLKLVEAVTYWHELLALLQHEVLHVVWQHPLRYQTSKHQTNITLATDVAVNQYLEEVPRGTVTLADLAKLLDQRLPALADSSSYLQIIQKNKIKGQTGQQAQSNQIDTRQQFNSEKRSNGEQKAGKLDTHAGWDSETKVESLSQQTAELKQILAQAWSQTPTRDRGLLPGKLKQQLEHIDQPASFNWKQLIKQAVGSLPQGKKSSYSRFNRRQPLRMDLPGQVTNLVTKIDIFVDNSGSMGDNEIAYLLTQIKEIVMTTETLTTVYSFDAVVHAADAYELRNQSQIQFKRIGGGGTRFQSIFAYLQAQHATNNDTLAIILTDGWGETKINSYHFSNVLWVLTSPVSQFSVENSCGKIATVANDVNYQRMVGTK